MGYFSQLNLDYQDEVVTREDYMSAQALAATDEGYKVDYIHPSALTHAEKLALAASFFHGNHSSQVMGFLLGDE
jgi:hypothetical protein